MNQSIPMTAANTVLPVFSTMLANLQHLLSQGQAHAQQRGDDADALLALRLAPDMLSLAGQVRYACISAKGGAAKLAGVPVPAYDPSDDSTLAQAQTRLTDTLQWLASLPADGLAQCDQRSYSVKVAPEQHHVFSGPDFARHWVLSHFHFHVAMSYALLRQHGVALGKADYVWGAQAPQGPGKTA